MALFREGAELAAQTLALSKLVQDGSPRLAASTEQSIITMALGGFAYQNIDCVSSYTVTEGSPVYPSNDCLTDKHPESAKYHMRLVNAPA